MESAEILEVNFLPYAPVQEEIKIGHILFWPFYKKKDEYIKDEAVKAHLDIVFKQYVCAETRKPIKEITIVSVGDKVPFKELSPDEIEEARFAISILSFCSIIDRSFINPVSSDNFQFFSQHFKLGDEKIATSHGSWIRSNVLSQSIENVLFITPLHICIPAFCIDYDRKILIGLEQVLVNRHKTEEIRILRALEWFNYANTNIDGFDYFARIIYMAIAFEILLKFKGKLEFMKKIKDLMCETNELTTQRQISGEDGKKINKLYTNKEWFVYDLYILRNKIVHGEKLGENDEKNHKGEPWFELAISFFEECIKKVLSTLSYYEYNSIDCMVWIKTAEKISNQKR